MDDILDLFQRYKDPVYRLALSMTGSPQDAEDVAQTVFLKLLEHRPALEAGKERAWLLQVTANQCRSLWRCMKRRHTVPLEEALDVAARPEEERLLHDIMGLGRGERAVLYLFYYEDFSTREIADMLRISQSAVTTRLQRARKKLRNILEQEGIYGTAT